MLMIDTAYVLYNGFMFTSRLEPESIYQKFHCQKTLSTIPPPLRTAIWSDSDAGGTPQSNGTATVIVNFSCKPSLLAFSAITI